MLNNIDHIQEDIFHTIDFLLDQEIKSISSQMLSSLQNINSSLESTDYRNCKNELLEALFSQEEVDILHQKYFNIFSDDAKKFILQNLNQGIQ
jgi:hypothetical protein